METLVRRLRSGSFALQLQASHTLGAVCKGRPETSRAAAAAGAIPVLVRLLHSSPSTVQASAANALTEMAESAAELSSAMLTAGAVPALLALLRSSSDTGPVFAANGLGVLCSQDADARGAVAAAGGITAAVQLLSSSDAGALAPAACVLALFIDRHREELGEAIAAAPRAIPRLVRLLDPAGQHGLELQGFAAVVLGIAGVSSKQLALACVEAGALPLLAELAQATDRELQGIAAIGLCSLVSQCPKEAAACRGILPALVHCFGTNGNAGALLHAAQSLGCLVAGSPQSSQAIIQASFGATRLLLSVMSIV